MVKQTTSNTSFFFRTISSFINILYRPFNDIQYYGVQKNYERIEQKFYIKKTGFGYEFFKSQIIIFSSL